MTQTQLPLFVYGTLLTGERAHSLLADVIERKARAVMPQADLFSLGTYPMLVDGAGQVSGEVYWVAAESYRDLLAVLDGYEGPPYTRRRRPVRVIDADQDTNVNSIEAWVYVGNEVPSDSPKVHDGNWRSHHSE